MTASSPIRFSFSEKEKLRKRKTAQGTAPRSEPRFAPADRDEIKSRGLNAAPPPETPPGNGQAGRDKPTEMLCTAEKVSVFGAKNVCLRAARHDSAFAFPSRGKVPEGQMRCSAAARLCRQMLHFASLTEILSLRYRLSVFLSRRKKNSEKERPLRGLRREVSPDYVSVGEAEIKLKSGAQCGSAPRDPPGNGCEPVAADDREVVHSGESFRIRAKVARQLSARHDPDFGFPLRGSSARRR